jgi:formate hydrogenlyase transcriptional activator
VISTQTVRVNVRVVAATNQDLGQLVIPPLTEFFVAKFAAGLNKPIDFIPDEVMTVLEAHNWPGNIRELQNCIERAVLFSPGSVLRLPLGLKHTLADADREHILETLNQTNWLIGGQDGAAIRLGVPRTTLIYKMRKLGIEIRRSTRARSIRQLAAEQCHAAANC